MKWLITGGCGFIGRALIRHLKTASPHDQIRVYDNLTVGTRDDLALEGHFSDHDETNLLSWTVGTTLIKGDILDADSLRQAAAGADVIVHLAANTGVAPSVTDPIGDCRANVLGTLNALEAARHHAVGRVVFASSGAPLGVQTPPLNEEMAPHPASPYGASKLAGEGYCSAYFHCFGVETVTLRFGNVYGEGSNKKASVVAKFIKQAMAGETLEIYGDGSQTRDFIYLGDLIAAVYKAATVPGIGGETFQIATNAETTIGQLTDKLVYALEEVAGIKANYINGETRQGDVARNYSDTRKAAKMLDWTCQTQLDDGLRKTVSFFRN
ncbi:NAD-dependent epimerase/dehydratase family protein [Sulfitobacter geojensis]|uniref:NAD-dependent epimerase/dehydratase family protein n=1 Tax=Sulfitobacter geojensis TaxID=1342299 RepID=UPI00046985AF|nr:NAD-dependent epimerase/dehydratase family protein [Sulfitobacter geojensis]KHA50147.1 NAD dependent epimerase/dehydratase [Sulfitobacter geojensis]NYI27457.1 UDP-glucose 4-epimerase [Sulfitobacter geojensis]